jgi:hypothetical protein
MIEMGLLWYEPSRGVPLADRIDAAADRYLERFGEAPNVCMVNQADFAEFPRVTVRVDRRMQPGYLIMGIEREERLPCWTPERRSSDEVEVQLLAPDGTVLRTLRPAEWKRTKPASGQSSKSGARPEPLRVRANRKVTVKPERPRKTGTKR